jgi:hypothetical protein
VNLYARFPVQHPPIQIQLMGNSKDKGAKPYSLYHSANLKETGAGHQVSFWIIQLVPAAPAAHTVAQCDFEA